MTTLVAKIAQASMKVGALATDKRNTQQNYDYISADKILERAGDALVEVGVVVFPSITSEETATVEYTDQYNKPKTRYDCVVHFGMIVSDGETQIELPWVGRGSDYAVPDKACYKAITSGHKYFLAKLLKIGVGNEDGEHESHEPQDARKGAQPQRTLNGTGGTPKSAPRPATPATQDVDNLGDELFGGARYNGDNPTDEELAFIKQWANRTEAEMWSVASGASTNEHSARTVLNTVIDVHGGSVTKDNYRSVYVAFLRNRRAKLQQAQAA